jgi:hypothetical protein
MQPAHTEDEILRLASDPTTAPETLAQLAESSGAAVCYQIAINPNTPELLLRKLWVSHPLAALENPILAYRALTTTNRFHELLPGEVKLALYEALSRENRYDEVELHLPEEDRLNWLRYKNDTEDAKRLPSDLMDSIHRYLAIDPSVNVRKAMLDRLPARKLHLFATDPDIELRELLAENMQNHSRHEDTSGKFDTSIDILCRDPAESVRAIVAASTPLTAFAHETLANDSSFAVRKILASEGYCQNPSEVGWWALVSGGDSLCLSVARNRACPESVRLDLTGHPDAEVRAEAWAKFNFSTSILADKLSEKLDALFGDPFLEDDRSVLAGNPSINPSIISRLMGCSATITRILASNVGLDEEDRAALLQNEDSQTAANAVELTDSPKLMRIGSKHESPEVRAAVAGRVGPCATKLRFTLATDPSLEVREAVYSYLTGRVESFTGTNIITTLRILSRDPIAKMRAAIVSDCRLNSRDMTRMGQDPSVRVRLEVLKRESWCPTSHYSLLDHKSEKVRYLAAKLLLESWGQGSLREKPRSGFDCMAASDVSARIRQVAAESGYTSVDLLRKLISDKAPEVQRSLVERRLPRTKTELDHWIGTRVVRPLKWLEAHRNPYCRAVAVSSRMVGKRRLMRMESDPCWFVRAILAKNGHDLDVEALQRLALDKHPLVQLCASNRLNDAMKPNQILEEGADQ